MPSAFPECVVDVVVVGAGVAGLTAAGVLARAGLEVEIVEARDRVGGRVLTDRRWGVPIELGATWIHGRKGNPIFVRARRNGLDLRRSRSELVASGGRPWSGEELRSLERDFRRVWQHWEGSKRPGPDRSLWDALPPGRIEPALEARLRDVALDYGTDLDELGLEAWEEDGIYAGGDFWVMPGMDRVIELLVDPEVPVQHGAAVRAITTRPDGVVVQTDEATREARAAICTVPLGVLQAGAIRFAPELPDSLVHAIGALGAGRAWTVAMRLTEPVLTEPVDFVTDLGPDAPWPDDVYWPEPAREQPVLVGMTVGRVALAMQEAGPEAAAERIRQTVERVTGRPAPPVTDVVVSSWSRDPHALGTWSHNPVGAPHEVRRAFASPELAPLFFAGEHTDLDYPGTLHGAWHSGRDAAERALRRLER